MAGSLIIIFITPFINKLFRTKKITRLLLIVIAKENIGRKKEILSDLAAEGVKVDEKKMVLTDNKVEISIEVFLGEEKIKWMQDYLITSKWIQSFSF
jgi:putative Mg2+ transporter-C (MgtC) family protein